MFVIVWFLTIHTDCSLGRAVITYNPNVDHTCYQKNTELKPGQGRGK